jgi:hypothetical protein
MITYGGYFVPSLRKPSPVFACPKRGVINPKNERFKK